LRRFTVESYLLFYERTEDGIRLVRVLHGGRRIEDLFD
jgi:plasmid stabilization system protein ParE